MTCSKINLSVTIYKIEIDAAARRLHLRDDKLAARRRTVKNPEPPARGYERLYHVTVQQAHLGADFSFLQNVYRND